MIAAVAPNPAYENLRDYVIANGGGGRPTAVRAFDQSARQAVNIPTGALPGVKAPIPTSSARPGKQTNQRIPYARISFSFPSTPAVPLESQILREGDISFVHRPTNANGNFSLPGHGPNRASTCGNIAQMNAMLTNIDPANLGDTYMSAIHSPFGIPGRPWAERWQQCRAIGRWTPDGVIISSEHEHGTPEPMVGTPNSNPGDLWNICIQGPTPLKNSYVSPFDLSNKFKEQNIDNGSRVMDKVFMGLFARENRDAAGVNEYYTFYWKAFTSRQALYIDLTAAAGATAPGAPGTTNVLSGPTAGEFARIVAVWRVGTILDNKLGSGRVTLNVCIEEWPLSWLRDEYNAQLGLSKALVMRSTGPSMMRAVDMIDLVDVLLSDEAPNMRLMARATTIVADLAENPGTSTNIDPFQFDKSVGQMTQEIEDLLAWRERLREWTDAATREERRRRRLSDPGPRPEPSDALVSFFDRMSGWAPLTRLLEIFLIDNETAGAIDIARVASFAEDEIVMNSISADQRVVVAAAKPVALMFAKLSGPLTLYRRIETEGLVGTWLGEAVADAAAGAGPAAAAGDDSEDDEGGFEV